MATKSKHLSLSDLNKALPADTAEKFSIIKMDKRTSTRFIFPGHGLIDLKTLSIKRAEQLVKNKAPFIERKGKK